MTGESAMTILVTGAAGYLGNQTVRKLVTLGRPVRAMVRHRAKAETRLRDVADSIEIVIGDVTDPDSLSGVMENLSAVIHYVAIAMEKGGQTYEEVNYQGTVNLLNAAQAAGVQRFINMSQNGARSDLPYRFLASKGRAQEYVAASDMQWTALRPSAIFGRGDAGSFAWVARQHQPARIAVRPQHRRRQCAGQSFRHPADSLFWRTYRLSER